MSHSDKENEEIEKYIAKNENSPKTGLEKYIEERKLLKKSKRARSSSSSSSYTFSRSRSSSSDRSYRRRRRRYHGSREHPERTSVLGVFGLNSRRTREEDLLNLMKRYGRINKVRIVYDGKTRNSRGFGFVYFDRLKDASYARRKCNGMRFDGRKIRVDYSITRRPHTPTPGVYMGRRSRSSKSYRESISRHSSYSHNHSRSDSH